jgi:hypothetical protein
LKGGHKQRRQVDSERDLIKKISGGKLDQIRFALGAFE